MTPLPQPKGFLAAGVSVGMKQDRAPDVSLIYSERPCVAAGATTRNRFCSPSVIATRQRLERGTIQAIVANSRYSNAGTGARGMRDAESMASTTARQLGLDPLDVAMASTGIIGQFLPMERIRRGIGLAAAKLTPSGWTDAARGIMTTDTHPKEAGRLVRAGRTDVALRGIAKGVGMIHPNMATTLSFVGTDARISRAVLRPIVSRAVEETFNSITVDGDTSTSDTFIILANGAAGGPGISAGSPAAKKFAAGLTELMLELALMLVRDGEGATKVIEVVVAGAPNEDAAREAARKIAASSLVKTAIHGCDANWGRIAMALGNAAVAFDQRKVAARILGVPVMYRGAPVGYDEPALHRAMRKQERIRIDVHLGAGRASATAWGSDLSEEYIRINADYRS